MDAGFSNVFALKGGFDAWVQAGLPVGPRHGRSADMHA
jgi:rhodanese-related sulfurtransferase